MGRVQPHALCIALIGTAMVMVSCGSSSSLLQSMTIAPSTATTQAQFVATGTRVDGSKVSPAAALWWNYMPWSTLPTPPPGITIDSTGKAACLSLPGTFTVWATAPADQHMQLSQMTMTTPQVVATAQLTCP